MIEWRELTLTPLAKTGQPANKSTESRTRENTCAVEGSREARTTEAESALVRDSDEVKLLISFASETREEMTHLFPSIGVSYCEILLLLLRLSAARFCHCHFLNLASRPVLKSESRRWTKKSPPANGQIESEVVADVSVPRTGESRARIRGGNISGRRGVGGGKKPSTFQLPTKGNRVKETYEFQ
jgi:hypothetical protein